MAEPQTYKNHAKNVPLFHYVLLPILAANFLFMAYRVWQDPTLVSLWNLVMAFAFFLTALFARVFALKAQDRVDVVSQRGRVRNVELRVTETIAPGQVFVPFHYAEANANQVTQSAFDPISREPNYKQSAVRVERSTPNAQFPTPKR